MTRRKAKAMLADPCDGPEITAEESVAIWDMAQRLLDVAFGTGASLDARVALNAVATVAAHVISAG
jgi:hypothetical protein